jgi:recombinational DNA repair protein RecR
MAYTPELDSYQSSILRRIAWALDMPMTKAMTAVIEYVSDVIDSKRVCNACRDKTQCKTCPFNRRGAQDAKDS